jgi:hypothetical protein
LCAPQFTCPPYPCPCHVWRRQKDASGATNEHLLWAIAARCGAAGHAAASLSDVDWPLLFADARVDRAVLPRTAVPTATTRRTNAGRAGSSPCTICAGDLCPLPSAPRAVLDAQPPSLHLREYVVHVPHDHALVSCLSQGADQSHDASVCAAVSTCATYPLQVRAAQSVMAPESVSLCFPSSRGPSCACARPWSCPERGVAVPSCAGSSWICSQRPV